MAGRVVPYAQSHGFDWYEPADAPPQDWLENNRLWINRKMKEGCTILDLGACRNRPNYPAATSRYYKMELEQIAQRAYAAYRKVKE